MPTALSCKSEGKSVFKLPGTWWAQDTPALRGSNCNVVSSQSEEDSEPKVTLAKASATESHLAY